MGEDLTCGSCELIQQESKGGRHRCSVKGEYTDVDDICKLDEDKIKDIVSQLSGVLKSREDS